MNWEAVTKLCSKWWGERWESVYDDGDENEHIVPDHSDICRWNVIVMNADHRIDKVQLWV